MRRFVPSSLAAVALVASLALAAGGSKDPMFVRWLAPTDPGDQTIRVYWDRAERGQLGPEGMVDLGTMLFYRGYPKDAVRYFHRALDQNPDLYEAWFRIGLVAYREGQFRDAEEAYLRCLHLLTGHGWCNFYMGLLKEKTGHPKEAMDYYRRAFKFAPDLADAKVNPELLYSDLQLGAQLLTLERSRFSRSAPMPYLEPKQVQDVRNQFEPPPSASASPTPLAASGSGAGGGPPQGPTVSVGREPSPGSTGMGGAPAAGPSEPTGIRPQRPARPTPTQPVPPGAIPPRISTASPEASFHPSWAPWG